ncbi:MAG: TIGR03088 family PEP-CTERM/XrtA system glycosyltransferase [Proteobacteria bacterium]|nr:TIGR03088 family PEP-CTERM/XrtA system glycosyltransferase [Pseudomonadota bacterium]
MAASPPPLILHVIHHLVIGGMENGVVNLINHMPATRYRHAVACIEDYSEFRRRIASPDVEVIALNRSRIGTTRLRLELFKLCRRMRPAIVHTRNLSGLDALMPARLAGGARNVHSEHGWDVDNLDGRRWKPALLRRLHAPFVDRYITVSKDLERFLVQRIGIRGSRITQIYNGVDTARFTPERTDAALPESFRGDHLIRIGSIGRLEPVKDLPTLLRAFAALLAHDPALREQARLVIVGDGPQAAPLRALADELGIARLIWFSGAIDYVPAVLRALDVFVLPSLNEGISNTLLEAMAAGLPVVASAVGGNVELVEDGCWGRLFPSGDVAALERHLSAYAVSTGLRRAHAAAGRQAAIDRYSLQAMVGSYLQTYDDVLAGR